MYNTYAGKCTTGNWELFVLLGEAHGVGIPLGWCFVHPKGPKDSHKGGKQKILIEFLQHFHDEWGIQPFISNAFR